MTMITEGAGSSGTRDLGRRRPGKAVWLSLLAAVCWLTPEFALAEGADGGKGSGSAGTMADQMADLPTGPEAVDQIMKGLDERLALSEEQQKEVRPHIEQMVASMQKLRERFEAGQLNPMALGMQIQMAEKKASVLIDPVLNDEQRAQYQALRQEQRRRMMEELQKRAAGQP